MIEGAFSKVHAARVYGVSAKIVPRWWSAIRPKGGSDDRPFFAARPYGAGTAASIAERIVALRRRVGPAATSPMSSASRPSTSAGFSSVLDCRGCPGRNLQPRVPSQNIASAGQRPLKTRTRLRELSPTPLLAQVELGHPKGWDDDTKAYGAGTGPRVPPLRSRDCFGPAEASITSHAELASQSSST